MKKSNIIRFMLSLMFVTLAMTMLMGAVDHSFQLNGELVQHWYIVPIVKTAFNIMPDNPLNTYEKGSLYDPAIKTLFARTLEEQLFPNNEFFMKSVDDGQFVVESDTGATVRYGVSGANPNVEVNRSVLPAVITKRVDDSNDYDLDEFTTDPILIQDTEALIVNYQKRASILRNHSMTLNTRIADRFSHIWTPDGADNIVRTTGADRAATTSGATGNRKKVTEADIIKVANLFDRQDVPTDKRFCVLTADMMEDLRGIDNFKRQDALGFSNIPDGVIARIHGIWVMSRSYMPIFDNTGTPVKKAYGAAGAATDNQSSLFWHADFVNRAKGNSKVFTDNDKPEYFGSLISMLCRAGGKIRKDKKGVVALVQSAA